MNVYEAVFAAVLAAINLIAFAAMGADKRRAQAGKWRISERTLFLLAFLFGGVGGTAGMLIFRHKTKHWYFALFFPLLAIAETVLAVYIFIWL